MDIAKMKVKKDELLAKALLLRSAREHAKFIWLLVRSASEEERNENIKKLDKPGFAEQSLLDEAQELDRQLKACA